MHAEFAASKRNDVSWAEGQGPVQGVAGSLSGMCGECPLVCQCCQACVAAPPVSAMSGVSGECPLCVSAVRHVWRVPPGCKHLPSPQGGAMAAAAAQAAFRREAKKLFIEADTDKNGMVAAM